MRRRDDDDVGVRQQFVQAIGSGDLADAPALARSVSPDAGDARAEQREAVGNRRADRAEADDQHARAGNETVTLEADGVLRPLALAWLRNAIGSRRNSASVTASACSAMVSADMPRELVITIGRATISGNSMPPTPAAGL